MERKIRRGEIYIADLGCGVGSEQRGARPVVIVQNDIGNRYSPTVIVVPISGRAGIKPKLPTHYLLPAANGLSRASIVLMEQIRTVDKRRLRQYVGRLDRRQLREFNKVLAVSVGLM